MVYCIFPPDEFNEISIELPLSKSISNRALVINSLTKGALPFSEIAKCDDTDVMLSALTCDNNSINIGAAGTAMRFLTAYFASQEGRSITLDGSARMRQRPIKALVDALRACGAEIEYIENEGYPPLLIKGKKLSGGEITLPASISSQYISALLMIAPTMINGLKLTLEGEIISRPYILMTLSMMKTWGVNSEFYGNTISIEPGEYKPTKFDVEGDWSASSYWYEIATLSSEEISIGKLNINSIQGDSHIAEIFKHLGIISSYNDNSVKLSPSPDFAPRLCLNMSEQPDLAQTIVVTCCLLGIPFHIKGLSTLKIKETDRLSALQCELKKLSFAINIENDSELSWDGERIPVYEMPTIETYNDHRMAMAFAPASIFIPGLKINDIEVVSKSYPLYWEHLRQIGFKIEECQE